MGYSAETIESTPPLRIGPERVDAVLAALREVEAGSSAGSYSGGTHDPHISWCQKIDSYPGEPIDVVQQVLDEATGYGFTTERDGDAIVVTGWGGEKLGSDYSRMMEAVAAGRTDSDDITWRWRGEDGAEWTSVWHLTESRT